MRVVPGTLAVLLLVSVAVLAFAADKDLGVTEENRYQALLGQLRCLVCQNQSIAESNAPLADDLRRQVRAMLLRGDSDAEIKRYLTDRYGEFVLYQPRFEPKTWLLWLGPFVLLVTGLLIAIIVIRHSRRTTPEPPPDPDSLRRVLEGRDPR